MLSPPHQAVILAGGQGARLRPLTAVCPKPMVEFANKPFLEHLLNLLCSQGITKVLLLLGYLPESIMEHFGDGSRFGLEISYSVTNEDDDTGTRLRKAKHRIDDVFLFLYCDNYVPFSLKQLWEDFNTKPSIVALMTVYANNDGYTKDNLRLGKDGLVEIYDKSRTASNLSGVDIGFMVARRDILDLIPETNCSFEQEVYPKLIARKSLYASVTEHRYYSVGDWARLPLTTQFFEGHKAVLIDRDGVLNKKAPQGNYITDFSQWEWMPRAKEGLRLLHEAGYRLIVITNQACIARGMLTEAMLEEIHKKMCREAGVPITAIYHCPHHWDDDCPCRKPKPGMLLQAQRDHHLNLAETYFVGDDSRDAQAAASAGARFFPINDQTNLKDAAARIISGDKTRRGLFPSKKLYSFDVSRLRIESYYRKVLADKERSMELFSRHLLPDAALRCPLCSAHEKQVFLVSGPYRLLSCAQCGMTYPNLDCDTIGTEINSWYTEESAAKDATRDTFDYRKHKLFVDRVQYFYKNIPGFASTNYRVLDYGCGEGIFLSVLDKMGIENKGLDQSKKRNSFGVEAGFNIAATSIENEPTEHYHLVTLFDVLEHINKPLSLFGQINRVLNQSGYVVIYIPNIHSVGWKVLGERHHCLHPFFHSAFHSEQSIEYLAHASGFSVHNIDYYGLDVIDCFGFKSHEDGYDYNKNLSSIIPYLQAAIDTCQASSHMRIILEKMI